MDKQLEEMIRDLIPFLVKEEFVEEVLKQPFNYFDDTYEDEKAICKELIRLNYRKIPENAVVLTREEFEVYEFVKKKHASNEEVRSSEIVQGILHHIKTVRKETAEKFAERAKEEAFVVFMGEPIIRASKIDEIAKEEFGGEI